MHEKIWRFQEIIKIGKVVKLPNSNGDDVRYQLSKFIAAGASGSVYKANMIVLTADMVDMAAIVAIKIRKKGKIRGIE